MNDRTSAPRFSLHLPLRYRPCGDSRWREGKTLNVSSSGAAFLTSEAFAPGSKLELEIWMNSEPLGGGRVLATSEVVRQSSETGHLRTAVRHLTYEVRSLAVNATK